MLRHFSLSSVLVSTVAAVLCVTALQAQSIPAAPRTAANSVTVSATPNPAYAQSTVTAHIHTTSNGAAAALPVLVSSTSSPTPTLVQTDSSGNLDVPFTPSLGSWNVTAQTAQTGVGVVYSAFGDSITAGIGATTEANRYVNRVASFYAIGKNNYGVIGDMACDEFPHVLGPAIATHLNKPAFYSNMIGTNDAIKRGAGDYEANFKSCLAATLAWLATPQEAMVLPGSAALVGTGGWSAAAADYYAATGPNYDRTTAAIAPAGSAGTLTTTVTTTGAPIYGWYIIDDNAAANACFTVTVDGADKGTFCARQATPLRTEHGASTSSVALFRIPVSAGAHLVVASTSTGGVALVALGSLPLASSWSAPLILSNDVPAQNANSALAPVSAQLAYNADVAAVETMLNADGVGILHVPTRAVMTSDPANFSDQVHPNDTGMAKLAAAELSVLANVPGFGVVSASANVPVSANKVTVALSTSTASADSAMPIGYNATVTDTTASAAPQGTLRILDGSSAVATVNLAAGATPSDSVSDTLSLPFGQHALTAQYTPASTDFLAATSNTVNVSVGSTQPHVTLTPVGSTTVDLKAGQSTTIAFNLVSVDGYSGNVQLSCGPLPSSAITCGFPQTTYTVAPGSTTPVQLTVSASYMALAGLGQPASHSGSMPLALTLLSLLAALAFLPRASSRLHGRLAFPSLSAIALLLGVTLLNGCAHSPATRQFQLAVAASANPAGSAAPAPVTLNVTVTE